MRKALPLILITVLVAGPAFAAQNPDIRIGLDADPPNAINRIDPAMNDFFDVYVVLDCFGDGGGTRGVGMVFTRTFAGVKILQTNLLGGLQLGDVEDAGPFGGWAIVAGVDCVYPDANDMVVAGAVNYLYLGAPGTITVLPNPVAGREVLDCDDDPDYYCIYSHFGVGADAPDPEEGCICDNAVEASTWGAIKSLYRQ